jgi:hypothetical protein
MFERLLSRLRAARGRRRSAVPSRGRAWLRGSLTRGSRALGRAPRSRPGGRGEPHAETGGRHRKPVTPGEVPGAIPPGFGVSPVPGESVPPPRPPAPPVPPGNGRIPPPADPVRADVGGRTDTGGGSNPGGRGPAGDRGAGRGAELASGAPVGGARARVRKRQAPQAPSEPPARTQPRAARGGQTAARRQRGGPVAGPAGQGRAAGHSQPEAAAARPWYQLAGGWQRNDGSKHCGSLEPLVHRQWNTAQEAPAEALHAVNRLAELPQKLKDLLASAVDAIYVGPGGVPELDEMSRLRGVPLPSGRATWDACAGAYGDRKIVVGTRPSPSPDVMCHEVGHAIDDSDAPPGHWQSDSAEFRMLYDQCLPLLVSDFHRQHGALGRREFFADAFAAIASRQRPALVDMLGGSTRVALNVMLFFNRRYGI